MMLKSAENNCKASHPTAHNYFIFAIVICMIAIVLLLLTIYFGMGTVSYKYYVNYTDGRAAAAKWPAFQKSLVEYYETRA